MFRRVCLDSIRSAESFLEQTGHEEDHASSGPCDKGTFHPKQSSFDGKLIYTIYCPLGSTDVLYESP
jgi:hypothetical protein